MSFQSRLLRAHIFFTNFSKFTVFLFSVAIQERGGWKVRDTCATCQRNWNHLHPSEDLHHIEEEFFDSSMVEARK